MNVNKVLTVDYENIANSKLRENKPNTNPIKPNTKPIKAYKMPKQTQNKAKQTQFYRVVASGEDGSNPTCRGVASGEDGSEAKKSCCRGNPHPSHRAGTVAKIKIVTVSLTLLGIDANLLALQFKEDDLWNCPG